MADFTDINTLTPWNSNKSSNFKNCYRFNHLIRLNEGTGDIIVNNHPDKFLPILTLSTNTDAGRDLKRDSFAILKFYNEINNLTDSCVDEDSDSEKNIQINNMLIKLAKVSNNYNYKKKSEYDRLMFLCKKQLGIKGGNINLKLDELNVEIYEFLLQGYSTSPREIYRTEKIISSDESECGKVVVNSSKRNNYVKDTDNERIRTCDKINVDLRESDSIIPLEIGVDNSLRFTIKINHIEILSDDLITFTNSNGAKKTFRAKINSSNSLKYLYNDTDINYILNKSKEILKKKWGIISSFSSTKASSGSNPNLADLIVTINPDKEHKFIIMGDYHGSFATFIRHLLRFRKLGIIDENCKLMDNYKLIFLGDIVDRGIYGYEIMMLLYCLLIINPDDIYINRGNHEEKETNIIYGLRNQMREQFKNDNNHNKINENMDYQSSAIIIKNPLNNKYIYLSHGGLPIEEAEVPDLSKTVLDLSKSLPTKIIYKLMTDKLNTNKNHFIEKEVGSNVRWSDYETSNIETTFGARGTIGYLIGMNHINEALRNGLSLIIRGHNDTLYNTKLIRK